MRKPVYAKCEPQRHSSACAKISRLELVSSAEHAGLSYTWSQTPKTGFLMSWLNCNFALLCSRIYELLPPKIQQWQSSPCVAEEKNKHTLEKIRRQQMEARQKLGELDLRHQELDTIVEKAKHAQIDPEQEQVLLLLYLSLGVWSR